MHHDHTIALAEIRRQEYLDAAREAARIRALPPKRRRWSLRRGARPGMPAALSRSAALLPRR
jgi:hypothetical protein